VPHHCQIPGFNALLKRGGPGKLTGKLTTSPLKVGGEEEEEEEEL